MDLSALIFVALAVAWAVYLIPKALKHHDEVVRSRSVEKFSHTMRVLARREPVDRRNARLVVAPIRAALRPPVETKARVAPEPVEVAASPAAPAVRRTPSPQAERAAARRAAKRRRNVLAVLLLANAVVVGLAVGAVVAWPWTAVPAGLLVAWLVACRVSVRRERAHRAAHPTRSAIEVGVPAEAAPAAPVEQGAEETESTGEHVVAVAEVPAAAVAEAPAVTTGEIPVVGGWEMVPTTLPTYVSKPAAQRRTVSTIDLDSTGVWSSGRSDEDSALARSAEESARSARESEERRRASGA
ncbi:hypothetical protein KDN32_02010 [Nocardioides sp. J2M5]|uniref:divisome protein SepX/GlpR n=1 Tax=Nocardioides palaemonis TaxID=2829810 RepID=UPI001BA9FEBF|nr:hypothetical protein [Nocardioides palaemonis]MBS2936513.1 hypothetical protein [Nocardioides palaemonis]